MTASTVYDEGLGGQPDDAVMAAAAHQGRILLSADTDFGELLANSPVLAPSVILLRRTDKTANALAAVLTANFDQVAEDLEGGAIVVITDSRVRARRLPINP